MGRIPDEEAIPFFDLMYQEQLVRLWKHRHHVEGAEAEGLSYEELPALWYIRGTSSPPGPEVPFDVAVASKYIDVREAIQ